MRRVIVLHCVCAERLTLIPFGLPLVSAPATGCHRGAPLQFRTVPQPDLESLDAVIVPVFADGAAPAGLPGDIGRMAEWVAAQAGPAKAFTPTTHLRENERGATRLVVVAAGRREEWDAERARRVASAGVRALWQSTARSVGVALETTELGTDGATQ